MTMNDPIISPEDLVRRLEAGPSPVLLDARIDPGGDAFEAGRIAGAQRVDLEEDLTGDASVPAAGGRHPLPAIEDFARRMTSWAITPDRDVVVYDDANGALAAARAWWMLRAAGHSRTFVLDGGLQAAREAGVPFSRGEASSQGASSHGAPSHRATGETSVGGGDAPYPASEWRYPTVEIEELAETMKRGACILIDVRAAERYRGDEEPLDPVAGHIPGAINLPLAKNLNEESRFKSPEQLRKMYAQVMGEVSAEELVLSCGSGVTACHSLLALEHAGLTGARLYVGSFSEWCRSGRPVESVEDTRADARPPE